VARRPDVLVIESGEIRLPGEVQMADIGLPKNVAYACMAETIVLALGGALRKLYHRPGDRVGEGARDLQAGPSARHAAGGHLGRERGVQRRADRAREDAGAAGAGRPAPRPQACERTIRMDRATAFRWAAAAGLTLALAPAAPAAGEPDLQQRLPVLLALGPATPFHRPLVLDSRVAGGDASATLEAVLDVPFADVRAALADARRSCGTLILHIDVKGCTAGPGATVHLAVVRRYDLPAEQATPFDFDYQVNRDAADGFSVLLHAERGPYGTSGYHMRFEAVPAGAARTAVRLSYGFHQSAATGWALGFYFGTFGRGKVGFSQEADGRGGTQSVAGVRGLLERNLMRYFLAVEAASAIPDAATPADYERRLRQWHGLAERYPRQLHDVTLDGYLALKAPLSPVGVMPPASAPARRG
jgi:hypothetical protein